MTQIRLHDSRTRRKVPLAPLDPENVRMYVCGPTVYDRAHLGNARPVVVFDTLYRLLRHVYGADHVTYVRNFTDVDDKINAAAQALKASGDPRSLEALIAARSDETIGWYHDDMDALGALRPSLRGVVSDAAEPRATNYIGPMLAMIEALIAGGHAYEKAGHVLFRVRSYAQYGALSGRSVDDMIAGARVEVAPFKEDPLDFVLWKPSDSGLPGWDSPWGRGRPGWHIECSAMSHELLGASFDIHGGGLDLQFPHHENEIAQSCCAHPGAGFASIWMHNEMLLVEGKKMSKSLGNFFTVRDLLEAPETAGRNEALPRMTGDEIRLAFLMTHYRKPMDLTLNRIGEVKATLKKWQHLTDGAETQYRPYLEVVEALADDLNTPLVLNILNNRAKDLTSDEKRNVFRSTLEFLGIGLDWRSGVTVAIEAALEEQKEFRRIEALIDDARANKDYARADYLRDGAKAAGADVSIPKDGAKISRKGDLDIAKLESLK
ncbi:cysteine--tRNA ligase [Frigidibacter mobilis]|uniref:Cysteine--tRNA ligase n=1 Tax=Frigidibacter mobilis TaxID=1335048 RepID=A0A159Z2G4_9RHOB|nr:cysteine--tRNA ligase [Frigidibacter mobilis]AMY69171.1 cysteinyl-tRNA synthetase [Frigidibacter mobilis]